MIEWLIGKSGVPFKLKVWLAQRKCNGSEINSVFSTTASDPESLITSNIKSNFST